MILIGWLWIGNYFYDAVLNRKKINPKNIDILSEEELLFLKRETTKSFAYLKKETSLEDVYVTSKDKIQLHGYLMKQKGNKWVILCHGYLSESKAMSILAEYYYGQGYNVLMPDARCHGRSHGSKLTMGYKESLDILTWMTYLLHQAPHARIVLHGFSLGASSILLSTQYKLPKNVKAIVSDSAYTSAYDAFYYHLQIRFGILTMPILMSANLFARLRGGFSLRDVSPSKAVRKNQIPTLFFHGKEDDFIPVIMAEELFQNNYGKKEKYILKGKHGLSFVMHSNQYFEQLESFLDKYMQEIHL